MKSYTSITHRQVSVQILRLSLLILAVAVCCSCQPHKPQDQKPPSGPESRSANLGPAWDGLALSYCELRHDIVAVRAKGRPRPNAPLMGASHQDIIKMAKAGKIQQALWVLEEENSSYATERIEKWRPHLQHELQEGHFEIVPSSLGGGTPKLLLEFEGGLEGIFKVQGQAYESDKDWVDRDAEIAAYQFDQILGTNIVPITIVRTVQKRDGSIQGVVKGLVGATPDSVFARNFGILKVFDYLTGNIDRKLDNILYWPDFDWLIAIDNGLAFRSTECGDVHEVAKYLNDFPALKKQILAVHDDKIASALKEHHLPDDAVERTLNKLHLLQKASESSSSDHSRGIASVSASPTSPASQASPAPQSLPVSETKEKKPAPSKK